MKTFVLDTNVLLHDPESLTSFKDNKIVIPMTVIEELDTFKRIGDERGKSARLVTRKLDKLRKKGKLSDGVPLKSGGQLVIELDHRTPASDEFFISKPDHRILGIARFLKEKGEQVFLITKDINLRIKAEALGIETQDYEREKVKIEELYSGWREIKLSAEKIDEFYKNGKLPVKNGFRPNEGISIRDEKGSTKSALAKFSAQEKALIPLFHLNSTPWGLKPLNMEQHFAIELLSCDDVNLVTLVGIPGAGKTLLALACGLQKTVEERRYRRLFIAKPTVPMGRDIGYLPGTKEEKLTSWMGAIHDNLEFLVDRNHHDEKIEDKIQYFFTTGQIEIESLTFIRGRSLPKQYIIIDDAQNLSPHEVKTIISRAGANTKIVLTGDPYQIDNPYLDASSNGLTYLVERFKGQAIYGHLTFSKSERSNLAALAAELL